ncbi:MAG: histidine phosphatase family protein [Bacilli bacterium]|nr:histidine phosphatase family protein [Bacilli bacterium]
MKIYLVRHGQTEANYEGKMQGRDNRFSLNDTGVRETKKLKEKLQDKKIDLCITSPLKRTWETAVILAGDRVYIEEDSRLIERDLGEYENKPRKEYDPKKYWNYSLNSNEHGVEKIQDVINRSKEFLNDIKKKYPGQNILIVSHGAIIRSLHHLLIGTDFKKQKDLTKLTIDNSYFGEYELK